MFYYITYNTVCMLVFCHVFLNDLSCPWFAKTCTNTYTKQTLSFKYNDRIYTTVDAKLKTFWSTVCKFLTNFHVYNKTSNSFAQFCIQHICCF